MLTRRQSSLRRVWRHACGPGLSNHVGVADLNASDGAARSNEQGVLANLPRTRPQRATPRRAAARENARATAPARGRTPNVHLKDFRARETHEFVPVGDGGVGYDAIVPRAIELGVEWLIVEQDQLDRPLPEALERSLAAVKVAA